MADKTSNLILKYTLQNAIRYNGKASKGAVIGKIIAEDPSVKKQGKQFFKKIEEVVRKVNSMSLDQQKRKLRDLAPELLERKKRIESRKLPKLSKVSGRVVMRFAPNPNGPISLGHARTALLNWFYVHEYKGQYVLRYDDTDPGKIKPAIKEAYKWIYDDLKWLGINVNVIVKASKRLDVYYKYAERLIKMEKAYVCSCEQELKSRLLSHGRSCLCRNFPKDEQLKRWKKMLSPNGYREGQAVLRIKTDLQHKNPAVRDWAAFRIVNKSNHPLKKAKVWPLLNFNSAIDDHDFKITHILRGVDLIVSDERQKFIFDYFDWKYPETLYNGKLLVSGVKSTSEADRLIKQKELDGWDDPRLATIMALRRRGFKSETIKQFIFDLGINKSDINVSMDTLAAYNRSLVDKEASRYFFVENPSRITIRNAEKMQIKLPLHPDVNKGWRRFKTNDEFYIADSLGLFRIYRLVGLFNFRNKKFISKEHDPSLGASLIHWVPVNDAVRAEVVMPDNSIKMGMIEGNARKIKIDEVVQLYRFGFCRLDRREGNKLVFYFAHN